MHVSYELEWTEDAVCRRRLRHASCPRNSSHTANVHRQLQKIRDEGLRGARGDDHLGVVWHSPTLALGNRVLQSTRSSAHEPGLSDRNPHQFEHFRKVCWCRIPSLLKASRKLVISPAICTAGWPPRPIALPLGRMSYTRPAPLQFLRRVRRVVRARRPPYVPMNSQVGATTSLWPSSCAIWQHVSMMAVQKGWLSNGAFLPLSGVSRKLMAVFHSHSTSHFPCHSLGTTPDLSTGWRLGPTLRTCAFGIASPFSFSDQASTERWCSHEPPV